MKTPAHKHHVIRFTTAVSLTLGAWTVPSGTSVAQTADAETVQDYMDNDAHYRDDLRFFGEVFKKMAENYYRPVTRENFEKFIYVFNSRIYPQLKQSGRSPEFVKWRSAAFLIDALKDPADIFSKFYPPSAAKDYETEVLGKRMDLGISGRLTDQGYLVTFVEPRSDAYDKGLRDNDVLVSIAGEKIVGMSEEAVIEKLTPIEGSTTRIVYLQAPKMKRRKIDVLSKEYFKQTVFVFPVPGAHLHGLRIDRFNRMTGDDMARFMRQIVEGKGEGLIIDLRGNPGGPPLAAREISAHFLPPGEPFAYFERNRRPPAPLDVPPDSDAVRFDGEIVILLNEDSGSASELFSGVLQRRGRAVIMGENSAGQVLLKSMFYFDDDSMVLLVTARGHHPDGTVFSFDGIDPDVRREDDGLVDYAAKYLQERIREGKGQSDGKRIKGSED